MQNELVAQILSSINSATKAAGNIQKQIVAAIQIDRSILVHVAVEIEANNKDRAARNNKLSALRMQLRRACKSLEILAFTVKRVDSIWQLADIAERAPANEADKLAAALDLIAEHAGDKLVTSRMKALGFTPPAKTSKRKPGQVDASLPLQS